MSEDAASERSAYQILSDLARGSVDGKHKLGAGGGVEQVNEMLRSARSQDEIDGIVWEAWSAVLDVATGTAHARQDGLLDFLMQLRRDAVRGRDGETLTVRGEGEIWRDLPTFGWVARDMFNLDDPRSSATKEQLDKFNNLSAFLARMTALSSLDDPKDPLDYSMFALWVMRDAFEETPPDGAGSLHHPEVKSAAIWVCYSGDALRKAAAQRKELPQNMGVGGDLFEERRWKGFGEERWAIWKTGFEDVRRTIDDPETKQLVEKALQKM